MRKRLLLVATLALLAPLDTGAAISAATNEPTFRAKIDRISPTLRERMTGNSWHPGCPVPFRKLRLVTVSRWDMAGEVRRGQLVVKGYHARNIVSVMRRLFEVRFPIRRMRLIDDYGGSDQRSMDADNTSAFNCRYVAGTTRWSEHAYGRAIDVNPVENPYVSGSHVSPEAGRPYVDRSRDEPGMIHARDAVVRAFARIGWEWGGHWSGAKDYQHFSSTGR